MSRLRMALWAWAVAGALTQIGLLIAKACGALAWAWALVFLPTYIMVGLPLGMLLMAGAWVAIFGCGRLWG